MLKFAVMFLCILCYLRRVSSAPVIKASGVQWTEPRGNGKGNLTLIMIPQNNSCSNDTDMLIAVKSDYQVVSHDTQLLNLVINEYQNGTLEGSKNQNQLNSYSTSSNNSGQDTCSNIENSPKSSENEFSELETCTDKGIQNIKTNSAEVIKSGVDETGEIQNDEESGSSQSSNIKQQELNMSKDTSNEDQTHQIANNLNKDGGKNLINEYEKIKSSDSLSYADFMKYLNSAGGVGQHSELNPVKGSDKVNFYEAEKKPPVRVNEQSNINFDNVNNLNSKNVSANDIFKFLSVAQLEETTMPSITKSAIDVFKFLGATERNNLISSSTQVISTINIDKLLNISDNNSLMFLDSLNNKNSNAKLFNDSEINIFKHLNITEPNIDNQLKKINEGNVIRPPKDSPKNKGSDKSFLSEVVNFIGKLKQEPNKDDHNIRPDPLISNQADELVSLDEGDFDTKVKLSKGVYSDSAFNDEILRKQLSQINLNQISRLEAEGNNITGNSSGAPTTCYTVSLSEGSATNGEVKLSTSMSSAEISSSPPSAAPALAGVTNILSSAQDSAEVLTTLPPAEVPSGSPADSTCRTSIVYLCNEPTVAREKPQKGMGASVQKITLQPQIDCVAYLRTKKPNQDTHLQSNSLVPIVESSMLLANNNEMPTGKDVPVLLNNSSPDYGMNVLLSGQDVKLARLHDPTINEEVEKIQPSHQIDKEVKIKEGKVAPVKSLNLVKINDQIVHPGQVLKMRFMGKKLLMEQMPAYRSEKFNKNCGSTLNSEPNADEMEPDDKENEAIDGATANGIKGGASPYYTGAIPDGNTGGITEGKTGAISGTTTGAITEGNTGGITEGKTGAISGATTGAITEGNTGGITEGKTGAISGATTGAIPEGNTGAIPGAMTGAIPEVTTGVVPGVTIGVITESHEPTLETISSVGQAESGGSTQLPISTQPENIEKATQEAGKEDKATQTTKESSIYVTECKVVQTSLQKSSEAPVINLDNHSTEPNKNNDIVGKLPAEDTVQTTQEQKVEKDIPRTEVSVQMTQGEQLNADTRSNEQNKITDELGKGTVSTEVTVQMTQEEKTTLDDHSTEQNKVNDMIGKQAPEEAVQTTQEQKISPKPHPHFNTIIFKHEGITSEEPYDTVSSQKYSKKKSKQKENIKIPGDSVKEIVIQIVRNTKKPKNKQCSIREFYHYHLDGISDQNMEIHRPALKEIPFEKGNPGNYEVGLFNEGDNQQENVQRWNPKPVKFKNQIDNLDGYDVPYSVKDSNLLDNVYVGKERNWNPIPVPDSNKVNNVILKGSDENDKALSYISR